MRMTLRVLLCSLVALPIAAGGFSPPVGGESESVTLVDEEISAKIGAEIAYHLAYTRWSPETATGTVIVFSHGLQDHRGWFSGMAAALVARGYTVYAFDRIGSGTSSPGLAMSGDELRESRGHVRDWHLLTASLDRMLELARIQNQDAKLVLWGDGYGAKVVTAWLLEHKSDAEARGVHAAVFTSPSLFANDETMPRSYTEGELTFSRDLDRFAVPMTATDGDNGAHWFVGPGPMFDRIRNDDLSIREVTRRFVIETKSMDRFVRRSTRGTRLPVATLHMLLRDDPTIDVAATETFVKTRASEGLIALFDGSTHSLILGDHRDEVIADVDAFLSGRWDALEGATRVGTKAR